MENGIICLCKEEKQRRKIKKMFGEGKYIFCEGEEKGGTNLEKESRLLTEKEKESCLMTEKEKEN